MTTLALLLLHRFSYDPFDPVLDDAASEDAPFESELGDLANFHIAFL